MTEALVVLVLFLGALPVVNTIANLILLRAPSRSRTRPSVSILIPARDEERTIAACIDAALASQDAEIEVIVLDDGSSDATAAIVTKRAERDGRLRLEVAPPLPVGWKGKPHACHILAGHARYNLLLFVDADVTLSQDAAVRLASVDADLVSGVPRQILQGFLDTAVVPMINSLIYGYLPVYFMRNRPNDTALTAACGQLMMVRKASYQASGAHAAVATAMHDGLQLARHFRSHGFRTDLIDATALASCRMYDNAADLWNGFAKNATEGMAKPVALPIWTVLLAGSWLSPLLLFSLALGGYDVPFLPLVSGLLAVQFLVRSAQAVRCREPLPAVLLHPLGVFLTLVIQWWALFNFYRGRQVSWRGRSYQARH